MMNSGPPDKVAMAQKLIQERVGGPPPPGASFTQNMPPNSSNPGIMGHAPRPPMGHQPNFGPPPQYPGAPPQMAPPVMPSPPMQNPSAPPGFNANGAPPVVPHNPSGFNYGQHPPQQPPQQPTMPQAPPPAPTPAASQDHSAAWAEYYRNYYQSQQARPAASAPASNNSQPDYTKAWEEYFKQQQAAGNNSSSGSQQAQTTTTSSNGQPDYSGNYFQIFLHYFILNFTGTFLRNIYFLKISISCLGRILQNNGAIPAILSTTTNINFLSLSCTVPPLDQRTAPPKTPKKHHKHF